ncbi:MAG: cytochrome c-type biogenesis protein CcmF [Bacteroidia bacterium]|jgi:cytochrome c-type biogenesis protein CcmF
MKEIIFNGEHLLPGNLGRLAVILALVSAVVGALSFWHHNNTKNSGSLTVGKWAFGLHLSSVLAIVGALFYIIYNHYFEYNYAWQHSSLELPTYYMISCFWEGQEGSFLLWMFWHAVIGCFIMFKPSIWRSPVMSIILLAQAVLTSMLLGIHFDSGYIFGSNPFELLRVANPEILNIPVLEVRNIAKADYLKVIVNGTGLNPLLQNYWMVIHPPTLFFGFATTIIPFAFAVSGLWNRKYTEWIKPALPWTLISVMVLGTGIIMGGVWAYESLTFGGYWAWDPVENASLVPWIVLIAAVHVMLIHKVTGHSIMLNFFLSMGGFILVLYATFLTRSGVLGDTSVHSFTDLGLSRQLLVFLFMFVLIPVISSFKTSSKRVVFGTSFLLLVGVNVFFGSFLVMLNILFLVASILFFFRNLSKTVPLSDKEESIYSREFWMFVGSLILLLSAAQIISSTSLPVFNKITGSFPNFFNTLHNIFKAEVFEKLANGSLAPPIDAIQHYNLWQLPMAIIIALLSGFIQFFNYRKTGTKNLKRRLLIIALSSLVVSTALIFAFGFTSKHEIKLMLLMYAAVFSLIGNSLFIYKALRFKWSLSGGSIAHIGFGLMLIGIMVSSANQEVISINTRVSYGEGFNPKETRENILLYEGETVAMNDYTVQFIGDTMISPSTYYKVHYTNNKTGETFNLAPNAQYNPDQGLMPNPDTRHYLTKDIYTYVSSVPDFEKDEEVWQNEDTTVVSFGDTLLVNNYLAIFDKVTSVFGDTVAKDFVGYRMEIASIRVLGKDTTYVSNPVFGVKDGLSAFNIPNYIEGARIRFDYVPRINDGELEHVLFTAIRPRRYIIMKAIVFPYINLLWLGTLVMLAGFALAITRRRKER